jgi:hypothetical protein
MAADLEEIGEVGGEVEREAKARRLRSVARHRKELVAARLPEELGARHVKGILGQAQLAVEEDIGVGEVDVERDVVGLHRRREHQRTAPLEGEVQPRQKTGVVVEQPRRAVLDLENVAELIEHGEAVAVLEGAPAGRGERDDARDKDRRRSHRAVALHATLICCRARAR